jgi:hypothetical protein
LGRNSHMRAFSDPQITQMTQMKDQQSKK